MKKLLAYFFCFLLSSALGAYSMYYFLNSNKQTVITKYEKSVIVSDKGISEGIDNIYDSVVIIQTYKNKKLTGIGSGFIYNKDGYILTNHHVVEDSTKLKLTLSNDQVVDVKVVGSDEYSDIAVLKIDKKYVSKYAKVSNNETKIGDTVFTIGSPMNINYKGTVTRGILSAKDRIINVPVKKMPWVMSVLQTDASINPGNSGGPLCNVNGEVIGVTSMKIVESDVEGISFAIPIEDALKYANRIITNTNLKGSYLGIEMGQISKEDASYGVNVLNVIPSSPASEAGIQVGDIIIEFDNKKIEDETMLKYYLYRHDSKDKVKIKILRDKVEKEINVTLGESK